MTPAAERAFAYILSRTRFIPPVQGDATNERVLADVLNAGHALIVRAIERSPLPLAELSIVLLVEPDGSRTNVMALGRAPIVAYLRSAGLSPPPFGAGAVPALLIDTRDDGKPGAPVICVAGVFHVHPPNATRGAA